MHLEWKLPAIYFMAISMTKLSYSDYSTTKELGQLTTELRS